MQNYKSEFIQYCLEQQALKFGQFTLKSGRISPYFFNAGALMKSSTGLAKLGEYYANCIRDINLSFDILFGPAYKGIPLAAVTAAALYNHFQLDKGFTYNRKEAKEHGEGGMLVGETALINKRVLILDDVITAGTAINHSMTLLQPAKAELAGIVVILDRQEKGQHNQSAIQEIASRYRVPVVSIITLDDIVSYIQHDVQYANHLEKIQQYLLQYGI